MTRFLAYLIILLSICIPALAEESNILSTAQSGKLETAITMLKKLPHGSKRSWTLFQLGRFCFEQGLLAKADELLNDFSNETEKDSRFAKYRIRAKAMREYISRYSHSNVEKTLKSLQELQAAHDIPVTQCLDMLNIYSARALNWKQQGVPEYEQVMNQSLEILNNINDNSNPTVALKIALLRCRILTMQGENQQCVKIVEQFLRHYFPDAMKKSYRNTPYPQAVRRLLRELGEQFASIAIKSNNRKDKIEYYSKAAACYLKSVGNLPSNHIEIANAKDRIVYFKEALQMLGYRLNCPAAFSGSQNQYSLYEAMINQKRFVAAAKALEIKIKNDKDEKNMPTLNLLYAQALCYSGDYKGAVASCRKAVATGTLPPGAADVIMNLANYATKQAAKEEARELYRILCRIAPQHPDIQMFLLHCAKLSVDLKDYEIAAEYFKASAAISEKPLLKARALFNAALSHYENKEYDKAVKAAQEAQNVHFHSDQLNRQLLFITGQSALLHAKQSEKNRASKYYSLAQKQFSILSGKTDLDTTVKEQSLLLGGIAALENNDHKAAIKFFADYIRNFVQEPKALQAANYLSQLYVKQHMFNDLCGLFKTLVKHYPQTTETITLILRSGDSFLQQNNVKQALIIYGYLLETGNIGSEQLLKLCERIQSKSGTSKQADKLLIDLIRKQLPKRPDNAVNGELYFILAEAQFRRNDSQYALYYINAILKEKNIYRYFDAKLLHAGILQKLRRPAEARQDYQEILISGAPAEKSHEASYLLAHSFYTEGNYEKAMAIAWSAAPLSGEFPADKKTCEWIGQTLKLLCECAKKLNNQKDYQEARKLYLQFTSKMPVKAKR